MSLIPADLFLTLRDMGGSGRPEAELRFVRDVESLCAQPIASLGGTPDWIIIDTPPALSLFTRAGLAAADYVVAPVRPRRASLAGTRNMLRTLRTMNALVRDRAQFLGAVITHWDGLALSKNFAEVRLPRALQTVGGTAFATMIPVDNQLDIVEPGANTPGARAYQALAREVVSRVDQRRQHGNSDRSREVEPAGVKAGA
jgi:chromosome partitioning protein